MTTALWVALVVVFWLGTRIVILRRRQALRDPEDPPVPAWPWLRSLAATPWILPTLLVLGAVLAAAALFLELA